MRLIVLLLLCHGASAGRHSVQYFHSGSSGVPNFPEFVVVGMVDDTQFVHYDSDTEEAKPKQDWMNKVTADDPHYWDRESYALMGEQLQFKVNIEIAKQRFNQTGGVHIFQRMVGCEWDDETAEADGFDQLGFDGEDFLSLDLKTESWVAARQQAVITKHKWDQDEAWTAQRKHYLTQLCPDWAKKYLDLGRSSLLRTELPSVSLLQKTPSSPVSCHATGFYPRRAALMWTKDGEELHEEVERGEILPNQDGTFQTSAELNLGSVPPEDWGRYHCVFQLAGVKEDMVTKLDKAKILTNWGWKPPGGEVEPMDMTIIIVVAVAVAVLVLVLAVCAVAVYRLKKSKRPPSPVPTTEVLEELNPEF